MKSFNDANADRSSPALFAFDESISKPPRSGVKTPKRLASRDLSLHEMVGFLRRNTPIIATSVLFFFVIGVSYILLASPQFTATARLLIDANGAQFFPVSSRAGNTTDASAVESQIEIIKSDDIADDVVQKLKLTEDPEFATPKPATLQAVLEPIRWFAPALVDRIFGPSGEPLTSTSYDRNIAIYNLKRSLQVNRVGTSYIAEVNFTSVDPEKAALIANAVADAYIDNQLDTRIYNTQRADSWIRRRLVDLRQNFENASDALGKFKAAAPGLIKAGQLSIKQSDSQIEQLNSTVESYKSIYETFLNLSRYVQSVQEQSFPITQARIITTAEAPLTKSRPKTGLTLVASLALGAVIGAGLAFSRGLQDTRIRTQKQVESDLGATFLGVIPAVERRYGSTSDAAKALRDRGITPLVDDCDTSAGAGEVLRALRSAIDARMPSGRGCVIGITSTLRYEGKTTLAANLATVFYEGDRRVLLIDGDLRNHTLSNGIAAERSNGNAEPVDEGLYAVVSGRAKLADVIFPGPFGWFLPVETANSRLKHPADFWSSPAAVKLFGTARQQYNYVIVDLPPLFSHVDADAFATHADAVIVLAKYENTKVDDLELALNESGNVADRLFGVIINGFPVAEKRRRRRVNAVIPAVERRKSMKAALTERRHTDTIKKELDTHWEANSLHVDPHQPVSNGASQNKISGTSLT